jgi:hypothetical protein
MLLNNMVLSPATTLVVYLLNYDSDFLKVAKLANEAEARRETYGILVNTP